MGKVIRMKDGNGADAYPITKSYAVFNDANQHLGAAAILNYEVEEPAPDVPDTQFTDPSLSVPGQAADAKATGDAIIGVEGEISELKSELIAIKTRLINS